MWAFLALCCLSIATAAKLAADFPQPATHGDLTACSGEWQQCGGDAWAGASCCNVGLDCVARDTWYSQCVRVEPRMPVGMPGPNGTCSSAWEQCGGLHWAGATCCASGFNCTVQNQWYAQCVPVPSIPSPTPAPTPAIAKPGPDGRCSMAWEQCGGADWPNATCCAAGSECTFQSKWYSQCIPIPLESNSTCAGEWEQCGGKDWAGASCCVSGLECKVKHEWYWQCLREQPPRSLTQSGGKAKPRQPRGRFLHKTLGTAPVLLQSAHALAQGGGRSGSPHKSQAGQETGGRVARAPGRGADVPARGVEL
uniref:CBM1 domain-containing protein n=1 Tax=Alexandrium catenella TaxID=2925 RepID=A0A7S1RGA2_ALECA